MYKKFKFYILFLLSSFILMPQSVYAMHVMEGFLPIKWCLFWGALSLPFIVLGIRSINKKIENNHRLKMMLGLSGAFTFVLSALKIPSITGSCSHPTGIGLGAILFGPTPMTVIGTIVLLFQALILAHGGLTTLGANVFSMAVVGSFSAYFVYRLLMKLNAPFAVAVFFAAFFGDLFTYLTTALQLALAFHSAGGFLASLTKFTSVFAFTQIPLAISEGILTVIIMNMLTANNKKELEELKVLKGA